MENPSLRPKPTLFHGSLFSGIGGFDLAAEWAGWQNQFFCDFDPFCQTILKHHFPHATPYADIKKTDFTPWHGKIDILSGGFPCQPFSQAGKRRGTDDNRYLWPEMLRAIREVKPRWVLGENVLGIVNWNAGMVFEQVCADLEAQGYEVQPFVLPASGVNAPHQRYRTWFIAHTNDRAAVRIPRKHEGENGSKGLSNRDKVQQPDKSAHVRWFTNDTDRNHNEAAKSDRIIQKEDFEEQDRAEDYSSGQFGRATASINEGSNPYRYVTDATDPEVQRCEYGDAGSRTQDHPSQRPEFRSWVTGLSGEFFTTDTHIDRPQESRNDGRSEGEVYPEQPSDRYKHGAVSTDWSRFPTQPPFCGGDDGIPSSLDGITLSKWRRESIKAYGNAIVPQVAFRIFSAINEFEIRENTVRTMQ